ncbi:MAG: 16S rRNA processing protein RimM [Bacteroidetes bacterium]|nr:MAG: 16S rRNA processing protein RimM [Bacteroidota bacterium]TNE95883.1 MAG: 16S rRNA processing protein RimM [Bacteroidota bacterium]
MNKADCFHLGYVAKLHGYKGEVSLFLDVTNPEDYATLDAFFIDINDQLTPFFVEHFKLKNKGFAAVKLEGIDNESDARKLLRKSIYLPEQVLPELEGNHFYDHEVIGFKVIDQRYGAVGELEQIIDFKSNPLLQITGPKNEEVLVPLGQDTIINVDRDNKELTIQSPEGLIELYLG